MKACSEKSITPKSRKVDFKKLAQIKVIKKQIKV